jgi:hypothetical protein
MDISRRNFLKTTSTSLLLGAAASSAVIGPVAASAQTVAESSARVRETETRAGDIIYRLLGRTKEKVSLIGLGGFCRGPGRIDALKRRGFRGLKVLLTENAVFIRSKSGPFFALKGLIAVSPGWSEAEPGERIKKKRVALQGRETACDDPAYIAHRDGHRGVWFSRPILRPCRARRWVGWFPGLKPGAEECRPLRGAEPRDKLS